MTDPSPPNDIPAFGPYSASPPNVNDWPGVKSALARIRDLSGDRDDEPATRGDLAEVCMAILEATSEMLRALDRGTPAHLLFQTHEQQDPPEADGGTKDR